MSRRALRAQTRMVSDFCTGVLHWFRTGFCTGQNSFALGNYRAGSTYPDFYAYVCAREECSASPWSFALGNRAVGGAMLALRAHVSAGKPSGAHMGTHMYTNIYRVRLYLYGSVYTGAPAYGQEGVQAEQFWPNAPRSSKCQNLNTAQIEIMTNFGSIRADARVHGRPHVWTPVHASV